MTPPRLVRRVLGAIAPAPARESFLDDLDEAFARRVATQGASRARWWYRRQVVTGISALVAWRLDARRSSPSRPGGLMRESIVQDLRYAVRTLRRSPAFTAVALLSLALGIGANVAVYSVVHAVLLRPLPYADPSRLVLVTEPGVIGDVTLPEFEYWRDHATTFAAVGASGRDSDVLVTIGGTPTPFRSTAVSAAYFQTFGTRLALGQEFGAADTRPGAAIDVVISDRLWTRAFNGDPSAIGHTLVVNDKAVVVRGVLPASFWQPRPVDVFFPLQPTGSPGDKGTNFDMVARLAPGVTADAANREMAVLSAGFPTVNADARDKSYTGLTTMSYQQALVGDVRTTLWIVFGATGLLLLTACTNLASLLVARLTSRRKEHALRLALGAGRARLWRQFAIENLIVALAGGALGVAGAYVTLDAMLAITPFDLVSAGPIRVDGPVLIAAFAVVIVTALVLSLPALTSRDHAVQDTLKATARAQGGVASQRARRLLVVSEVALSVTLLVGAALLSRSLLRLWQEPLGFSPEGVLTFWTAPPASAAGDPTARARFELALTERLRAIPGVTGAGATNVLPLAGQSNFPTEEDGHPDSSIGGMEIRTVTPGYFDAMKIPIIAGRSLTANDTAASEPVILVSETVANRWWPGTSPLGGRVAIGLYRGAPIGNQHDPVRTVVGVVGDAKSVTLTKKPRPTVYVASPQLSWLGSGSAWAVRASGSIALADAIRRAVADIDPRERIGPMQSMSDVISGTTAAPKFNASLSGGFALIALALTAIGVYGVLAFSVARRVGEIGLRMALGASPASVIGLILREGMTLMIVGLAIGLGGAYWLSRTLTSLLFGVTDSDVVSFVGVSVLLVLVGLAASAIPAGRASRIDPLEALRME